MKPGRYTSKVVIFHNNLGSGDWVHVVLEDAAGPEVITSGHGTASHVDMLQAMAIHLGFDCSIAQTDDEQMQSITG